ncbi:MAG: SDR family NAD(P)-dependent oxidoreductase [Myxococcota bacterium]
MPALECRLVLTHSDFIMQNHRVHGVSLMPGVVFLDIIIRMLAERGIEPRRVVLRDILFTEPVSTEPGTSRELLISVDGLEGGGRLVGRSRLQRDGVVVGDWDEHVRAELSIEDRPEPPALELSPWRSVAAGARDVESMYAIARREGIVHGDPMKCRGSMTEMEQGLLVELRLDSTSESIEEGFHLHPAKLDASTIVAYAQTSFSDRHPFIPVFVREFWAPRASRGPCFVHVPGREQLASSGDVIRNDYALHDEHGQLVAQVVGLTCKRIRHPELITRLVGGQGDVTDEAAAEIQTGAEPEFAAEGDLDGMGWFLRERIAERLGRPPAQVPTTKGFYDLGLDSVDLLELSEALQGTLRCPVYPTLLFEFSCVDDLARHLHELGAVAPSEPRAESAPTTTSTEVVEDVEAESRMYRPQWEPDGADTVEIGAAPVLVIADSSPDASAVAEVWRARGVEVTVASLGVESEAEIDRISTEAARLLAESTVRQVVWLLPEDEIGAEPQVLLTAMALGKALVESAREAGATLVVAARTDDGGEPTPLAWGMAAALRTMSAETSGLRARVVVSHAADPSSQVAERLCQELHRDDRETLVSYREQRRHRLRYALIEEPPPNSDFLPGGVYLIAGGSGGLGRSVGQWLARERGARVALVGRREADADLQRDLASGSEGNGEVVYLSHDLSTTAGARAAVDRVKRRFGSIDGVLQCAGTVRDGVYLLKRSADVRDVCRAKLSVTRALAEATRGESLSCWVTFSSLSGSMGNRGQTDYAFANAYLEGLSRQWSGTTEVARRVRSIAWPLWEGGGMSVSDTRQSRSEASTGFVALPTARGLELLRRAVASEEPVSVVLHGDPRRFDASLPMTRAVPASPKAEPGTRSSIAIVGMAGRYPGAANLDQLWNNLESGRDCITEIPADRWDHTAIFDPERGVEGKTYGRWGGFLDDMTRFEASAFGISRREAERMDPQERLFLQTSWQAIEDAGEDPMSWRGREVGVFAGVMWNHYQLVEDGSGSAQPTALLSSIANRTSFALDLRGPSLATDTMCSSSLTAIHLAVESLRRGECDAALAGGVNVITHPQKYLQLAQGQFLSEDGRCRAFGAGGTGYVQGEGVGVLVLMRLEDARAAGHPIRAVIRGSWTGHGGRTGGFTVPDPSAQARVIRRALKRAAVDPKSVSYVEAHGTGTSLGDPIEIKGMVDGYGATSGALTVGSIKSNLGHLEGAAGVAGVTKVVLQMQHRQLAPSLHSRELNPHIDFDAAGIRVPGAAEPWIGGASGEPLRAGISAFGAGGSNVHLLLEAADEAPATSMPEQPVAFVLSARDQPGLRRYARDWLVWLSGQSESTSTSAAQLREHVARTLGVSADDLAGESIVDLGLDPATLQRLRADVDAEPRAPGNASVALTDIAHTLQVGRPAFEHRLAVVVRTLDELRRHLESFVAEQPASGTLAWWGEPTAPSNDALDPTSLEALAQRWQRGEPVSWPRVGEGGSSPRRINLPPYPFHGESYWYGRWKRGNEPGPLVAARPTPDQVSTMTIAEPTEKKVPDYHGDEVGLEVLESGIAVLMLQAEAHDNMFTSGLLQGLQWALAKVERDPRVRALVLSSRGPTFCMGGTPEALERLARKQGRFTDASIVYEGLLRCPVPVISAMRGHASGGGLMFGLYADIVVMSQDAVYGANFLKYGFTPGMGATYVLEKRVGSALASEMFLTGRGFGGRELERRGCNATFRTTDEVLPHALELARAVAAMPPSAVRVLKAELAGRWLRELPATIERELSMHERVLGDESLQQIERHLGREVGDVPPPAPRTPSPIPEAVVQSNAPTNVAVTKSVDVDALRRRVETTLVEILGKTLYLREDEIDHRRPFNELGVDSIGAVTIIRDLNDRYSMSLDSVLLYEHPTVERLASYVAEALADQQRSTDAVLRDAPAPIVEPQPLPAIEPEPEPVTTPPTSPRLLPLADLGVEAQSDWPVDPSPGRVALAPIEGRPPAGSHDPVQHDSSDRPEPEATKPATTGPRPIAVIGMSGRFPDAPDLDALWTNLAEGRSSVREIPRERWDVERYYDPDHRAPGKTLSKWGALLDDIDRFDARLFNISPMEAEVMDPQQRLFLEQAWASLEDAGYASSAGQTSCGVFVGCAAGDYADRLVDHDRLNTGEGFLGTAGSVLAARIGYVLDLTGPTVAIDTACSSSLVALHMACEAIRSRQCSMAIAGGVALMVTPHMHVRTSKLGILSRRGVCAPFDISADGTALGEGVGAVVLKDLEQAIADGDHIHAVVRGSGIGGDGRTNGLTAPNAQAQASLLRTTWERSGISPSDIDYIEAHGTGTELGDPIELKAIVEAMGEDASGDRPCGVGSFKSNVGHTTMAAGIGGLFRAVLAIKHGIVPPTAHFQSLNPKANLGGTRLCIDAVARPWNPGAVQERVATVSAFGFSGTNAHVVVSGAPPRRDGLSMAADQPVLVPVSGRTTEALRQRVADLAAALDYGHAAVDVAFSLAVGRSHLNHRVAFVARGEAELRRALSSWSRRADGESASAGSIAPPDERAIEVATARPEGESALRVLADAYEAGRDLDWSRVFAGRGGRRVPLPTYPFEDQRFWLSERTSVEPSTDAQTYATTHYRVAARDEWVADHRVAGRSLVPGAACIAWVASAIEASSFEIQGLRWLEPLVVDDVLEVALTTGTGQGGTGFRLETRGGTAHATGRVRSGTSSSPEPVRDLDHVFRRCSRMLDGADVYAAFVQSGLEYGPSYQGLEEVRLGTGEALGRIRLGRGSRIDGVGALDPRLLDVAWQAIAALTWDEARTSLVPFSVDSIVVFDVTAPVAYSHVRRIDASHFDVELLDATGQVSIRCEGMHLRAVAPPRRRSSYRPTWQPCPTPPEPTTTTTTNITVIHEDRDEPLVEAVRRAAGGSSVNAVSLWESSSALERALRDSEAILVVAGSSRPEGAGPAELGSAALRVTKALFSAGRRRAALALTFVVRNACALEGGERPQPRAATWIGLSRVITAEVSRWHVTCVDIGSEPADERLARALVDGPPHPLSAIRQGAWHRPAFSSIDLVPPQPGRGFERGGVYLIVGGAGGIGHAISRELATRYRATIAWVGRRPLDAAIEQQILEIEKLGGRALYQSADVSDADAFEAAVTRLEAQVGQFHGAIHCAAVFSDRSLIAMEEGDFRAVLAPKVAGAEVSSRVFSRRPLKFMVFFSSAASFVFAGGQANYAAASTFLDAHAASLDLPFPVSVVNWGYWGSVGAFADEDHRRRFEALGVEPLNPEVGMDALERIVAQRVPQVLVLDAPRERLASFGIDVVEPAAATPRSTMPAAAAVASSSSSVAAPAVLRYVREIFAEVLKYSVDELDPQSTFEAFGVDSLVGAKVVDRLAEDVGELPATFLFEHMTIASVADALSQTHGEPLARMLGAPEPKRADEVVARPSRRPAAVRAPVSVATDIAVVGVSGRYPRSPDIDALWRNLRDGVDCMSEIPADRWNWRDHFDGEEGRGIYSRWGGFLEDVEDFDPGFFGILPRDASEIDPQERLFLENSWHLLEQVGQGSRDTHVSRTGVFVGVMYGAYGQLAATHWPQGRFPGAHSAHWSIANRVSYTFDFQGPSYAVDTACSSSLTAVHLACQSILAGECEQAIAGGVNLILHPAHYAALCHRRMLARDPHCKVFDERADGYVPGEGVGAVMLKSLAQAEADGDTIWAVIKGSHVNAGGKTSGYTVPNPNAQAALIETALKRANVEPRTVSYIEAHGTGTALGDPIEVVGLSRALRDRGAMEACAIGSVKANLGHLEGAAGIVGLTKVLLQLKHRQLAPCVNLDNLNPRIDLDGAPVEPQRALADWPRASASTDDRGERVSPRRAGVSSFGAGGANVHVVLEEYVGTQGAADAPRSPVDGPLPFLLSARSERELDALVTRTAAWVEAADVSLESLVYTSQIGRREMPHRIAVLASSVSELGRRLRAVAEGDATVEGVVRGTSDHGVDRRSPLLAGEEGKAFAQLLMDRGDVSRVAQAWVEGLPTPWSRWWTDSHPPRAPLPGYPFARKRFWVDPVGMDSVAAPSPELPLRHELDIDPSDPIVLEHRVDGTAIVPGMAWLEIVRRNLPGVTADSSIEVEGLTWPTPMLGWSEGVMTLQPRDDGYDFSVESVVGDRVYARGYVRVVNHFDGRVELQRLQARMPGRIDSSDFYTRAREGGLDYGPTFQVIRDSWEGATEVLIRLETSGDAPLRGASLRPDLADGLVQGIIALEREGRSYLPTAVERIVARGPWPSRGWAHVVEVEAAAGTDARLNRRFDVTLVADDGQVMARLHGVTATLVMAKRVTKSDPSPIAAPPVATGSVEEHLEAALRGMARSFLLVEESDVDLDASLEELGFDSLSLVDLIDEINESYGLDLAPQVLFDCPTLRAVGRYLATNHADAVASSMPASVALEPTAAPVVAEVVLPQQPVRAEVSDVDEASTIAIVGAAAVLPGSATLDELWDHLVAGDDLVGPVPPARIELYEGLNGHKVWGGFVDDVDRFDAAFFRVSPREATLMDPQQRLFLEVAYRAVESSGHRVSSLAGTRTGLFVGVGTSDYGDLLRRYDVPIAAHCATGIAHSILANRVSFLLDLQGPSEAIDTACSSSLVAIHRAARAILDGECDVALAGGVNLTLSPGLFQAFTDSGMLSPQGRCKTFDANADGYVRGEGAGAIVIKTMAKARADGDDVLALIRGSAVGHGGRTQSLTAPSPAAQERVLVDAYLAADVDPSTVSYVEAHGTGTKLGDPVEVEALLRALRRLEQEHGGTRPAEASIGIGSVKTNIGHLEAAAGIAGVLKVVLAMRHRQLPPMLHYRRLNPHLKLEGSPLFVLDQLTPWAGRTDADGRLVHRAGVSSFGFGGTNAHVVLEGPPASERSSGTIPAEARFLPLSAPKANGLRDLAAAVLQMLEREPSLELSRLLFTYQFGRDAFDSRVVIATRDRDGLVAALVAVAAGNPLPGIVFQPGDQGAPHAAASWLVGEGSLDEGLWPSPRPTRIAAPGCPWNRTRFWFERPDPKTPDARPVPSNGQGKLRLVPARRGTPARASAVSSSAVAAKVPEGHSATGLREFIEGEVSTLLGVPRAELSHETPFVDLGLDSIFAMQLMRRIESTYGVELATSEIYDHDTIARLATFAAAQCEQESSPAEPIAASDQSVTDSSEIESAANADPTDPNAADGEFVEAQSLLLRRFESVLDRPVATDVPFSEQLSSFDMLRVIADLERRLGTLRKNLLFEYPTVPALTLHLVRDHGADRFGEEEQGENQPNAGASLLSEGLDEPGPWLLAKTVVRANPRLQAEFTELEGRHGKEGGLPNRDISPLVFLDSARRGYFNCARRGEVLFAFSSVASEEDFPALVRDFVTFAQRNGLAPNFLSVLPMEEAGGVRLSATPFGVVQRLPELASFVTTGKAKRQLRYMLRNFTRDRTCRTVEYQVGTSTETDRQIGEMIDRWCETKRMINPYVHRVREELVAGRLDERHRLFLTYADDALANVVILTSIPSENGYLLDLEFYPAEFQGGLEFALVRLFELLQEEGCTMFSFGGTFGVKATDSANADPQTEADLEQLREDGIFDGRGNYQFKNKFRPDNVPIYLCRPLEPAATPVAEIILMIASPTVGATKSTGESPVAPVLGGEDEAERQRLLEDVGHNPLVLPAAAVPLDLSTDSWAEIEEGFVAERMSTLRSLPRGEQQAPHPLPFRHVFSAPSGRDAEAMFCGAMSRRRGVVLTNGLFPTWSLNLVEAGLEPHVLRPSETSGRFRADVDLEDLVGQLATRPGDIAFVCLELSNNAGGGHPLSIANLRAVREQLVVHGIPLVLDATRLLENAYFVAEHETGRDSDDVWAVAREMLALADSITLSLSKDFATDYGGVVATRDPKLVTALHERRAMRGNEVNASNRRLIEAALARPAEVAPLVRARMDAVAGLWSAMRERGLPVPEHTAGHCVVLDVSALPAFASLRNPLPAFVAELYRQGGVRVAPHLVPESSPMSGHVRFAVPVGMPAERLDAVAEVVARIADPDHRPLDLEPMQTGSPGASVARYRPVIEVSPTIVNALEGRRQTRNENAEVVAEICPDAERRIVSLPEGQVEVFMVGDGPPAVLMHPFNIGAGIFADQLAGLRDAHRVVVIHHPGVGATTAAPDLSLDGLVALLHDVIRALEIDEPLHVVGASVGGLEAQAYALRYPEQVASLTLLCSSYRVGNRNGVISPLADVVRDDFAALVAERPGFPEQQDRLAQRLFRCESMAPQIGLRYIDEFEMDPGLLARLPQLKCPTLIVHGGHDTVIDRTTARALWTAIDGARWVELEHAGHFPSLTDPAECNALLREAFASATEGDSGSDSDPAKAEGGGH